MSARGPPLSDDKKVLRQEREYTTEQVKQIRQEFGKKLEGKPVPNHMKGSLARDLWKERVRPEGMVFMATDPQPYATNDKRGSFNKSATSLSKPRVEEGKTGGLTYGTQIVQIPETLLSLDWSQAKMGGNWKPTDFEGVMLVQELIPPIGSQDVEGEVTNESLVRQPGWGADNDAMLNSGNRYAPESEKVTSPSAMPVLNSGSRYAPISEKVTISQRDMKCCNKSYKEANEPRPASPGTAANGRKCFFRNHDVDTNERDKAWYSMDEDNLDDETLMNPSPLREVESKKRRETVRANVGWRNPTHNAKNEKGFHEVKSRVSPYNEKPEKLAPHIFRH